MNEKKVVIVMPAYNAEKTLERTYYDIPEEYKKNIILVDDASSDRTVEIAKNLGLKTIVHPKNMGYGANQKTCYREALKMNPDVIIMIHPDYQYDATLTHHLLQPIFEGKADIVIGSRIRTRKEALQGGMPLYKYLANRFLTFLENIITGENLSEWHTGFRAYTRKFLNTVDFEKNSNGFVFDQQILIQAVYFGFTIREIPVPTRYFKEASSINFFNSMIYGISTLWLLFRYILHRLKILNYRLFYPKNNA
jgi:glycosyltransferase involved in cell wall biosynthesis